MKAGSRKNNRGFTLAELLVAVALIGILVSVSVVIFTGRTAEAKENVCKANRDSMQHGTVVISMTERVNWQEEYKTKTAGLHSQVSEDIILYLVTEEYIDDFKCPAGGKIYAASVEEDLVTFKCTYHDDGMEPGEENINNQAAKDLADAVNKYVQGKPAGYKPNNSKDIKEFLQTDGKRFIVPGDIKNLLTDSVIEYVYEKMKIIEGEDKAVSFRKDLYKYRDQDMLIVPYLCAASNDQNKVITYYTTKESYEKRFGENGKEQHGATKLICYNGRWYVVNTKKAGDYILTQFTNTTDIQVKINELVESGSLIAI